MSGADSQCGCAWHVRILAGPAIGCDVTSVVSGESREGERLSEQASSSRQQAAGRRAGGETAQREGASEQ